jgi:hypothetical protein
MIRSQNIIPAFRLNRMPEGQFANRWLCKRDTHIDSAAILTDSFN